MGSFFETPGATLGDLATTLERLLGSNRARALMIATTETTRAASEGQNAAQTAAGLPRVLLLPPLHPRCRCGMYPVLLPDDTWVTVWDTNQDEIVCETPINTHTAMGTVKGCKALNKVVVSEGAYFGVSLTDARRTAGERRDASKPTTEEARMALSEALADYRRRTG